MLYFFDFRNTLAVRMQSVSFNELFRACVNGENPYLGFVAPQEVRNLIKQLSKLGDKDKYIIITSSECVHCANMLNFVKEHYPWVDWDIVNVPRNEDKIEFILRYASALNINPCDVYIMDNNYDVVNAARTVEIWADNTLEFLVTKDTNLPMFGPKVFEEVPWAL